MCLVFLRNYCKNMEIKVCLWYGLNERLVLFCIFKIDIEGQDETARVFTVCR